MPVTPADELTGPFLEEVQVIGGLMALWLGYRLGL
jgi:hypothetical protein